MPQTVLSDLGFRNNRGYRVFNLVACRPFLSWLEVKFHRALNQVVADPFDFDQSEARYPGDRNRALPSLADVVTAAPAELWQTGVPTIG